MITIKMAKVLDKLLATHQDRPTRANIHEIESWLHEKQRHLSQLSELIDEAIQDAVEKSRDRPS